MRALNYNLKRITKSYGDSEEQSKANIKKSDRRRAKFYNDISGLEWGNFKNYNICIDSSIEIEQSIKLIKSHVENK